MIRDTSLIMQMQLAIMGIVLVGGLFYLWRSCCRMEEKLNVLTNMVKSIKIEPSACNVKNDSASVDAEEAEEFMKQVFGGDDTSAEGQFMMFVPSAMEETVNKPIIEEIVDVDQESEAETETTNPLSKSKLKRMNIDTLKDLCHERGLSSEGSKNVLMNRLLGLERD